PSAWLKSGLEGSAVWCSTLVPRFELGSIEEASRSPVGTTSALWSASASSSSRSSNDLPGAVHVLALMCLVDPSPESAESSNQRPAFCADASGAVAAGTSGAVAAD